MTAKAWQRRKLLVAGFLWGCSTSQLALLAVVLRVHGISEPAIGVIFSTSFIPVVLGSLISGSTASRLGAVRTLRLGGALALAGTAGLPFAVAAALSVALARVTQAIGGSLFTTSGQLLTKGLAAEGDQIRAVGWFTAMFLIPAFFGPAVGEWALKGWGEAGYFAIVIVPIAAAQVLLWSMPPERGSATAPPSAGYLALLRDRRIWLPNAAGAMSGMAYGFAWSFLPLMLAELGVPMAAFFSPFAVMLLLTRFLGLKHLQRLPVPGLAALGLVSYALGFGVLAASPPLVAAIGAGCLFGIGYGIVFPTIIEWCSSLYSGPAARAHPVALANATFNCGPVIAALAAGSLVPIIGWRGVLAMLGAAVILVFAVVVRHGRKAGVRPPAGSIARAS